MLKVAVLGTGGISGAHIPGWLRLPEVELVAICDVQPDRMERFAGTGARQYTDAEEMFEKEEIDILDICLPTFLHAEYSIKAMERGINVLCEKPISLKKEDVKRVYETAEKNNVKFMIAHVLRFWPEYVVLKDAIDNGTYGKLLCGHMNRLGGTPGWSWENWMKKEECSGLVPFDLHIHDLDYLVYTLGKPTNCITHRARFEDHDIINATYEFDGGLFITADSCWYNGPCPFTADYRMSFEKAVVEFKDGKLTIFPVGGQAFEVKSGEADAEGECINLPATDAYFEEISYFTNCVLENKKADVVKPEELETVLDLLKQF